MPQQNHHLYLHTYASLNVVPSLSDIDIIVFSVALAWAWKGACGLLVSID